MPLAVGALVVLVFAFVIFLVVSQRKKLKAHFAELGTRLGCSARIPEGFFGGFPSLDGTYRGRPLKVFMFTRGSGKNQSTYTAFDLDVFNPGGFGFHIFEQGFFTTLATKFGMEDIQTGDPDFDREFIVQASDESLLVNFLTPTIKQRFMEMAGKHVAFGIKLEGGRIHYETQGTVASMPFMEKLIEFIETASDCAEQVERMQGKRR